MTLQNADDQKEF